MAGPISGAGNGGRRDRLLVVAGALVAACAVAIGVSLAAAHPAQGAHHHQHGVLFGIIFAAAAAILAAGWTAWLIRRANKRPGMQRLRRWSLAERRANVRAVRKGEPLTAAQRELAQAQLETVTSQRRVYWFLPFAVVVFVVNAVLDTGGLRTLWIVLGAVELVAVPSMVLLRSRVVRRFERALSDPGSTIG